MQLCVLVRAGPPFLMGEQPVFYLWVLVLETHEAESQARGWYWFPTAAMPVRSQVARTSGIHSGGGRRGQRRGLRGPGQEGVCPCLFFSRPASSLVLVPFSRGRDNPPQEPGLFSPTAPASRPEHQGRALLTHTLSHQTRSQTMPSETLVTSHSHVPASPAQHRAGSGSRPPAARTAAEWVSSDSETVGSGTVFWNLQHLALY